MLLWDSLRSFDHWASFCDPQADRAMHWYVSGTPLRMQLLREARPRRENEQYSKSTPLLLSQSNKGHIQSLEPFLQISSHFPLSHTQCWCYNVSVHLCYRCSCSFFYFYAYEDKIVLGAIESWRKASEVKTLWLLPS